jgi:F-type H+-transporting ATPase subunit alpha
MFNGELVEFDNGLEAIVLNLEEVWWCVLLGPSTGMKDLLQKNTTYCFS